MIIRVQRAGDVEQLDAMPVPVKALTLVPVDGERAGVVVNDTPAGLPVQVYVGGLFSVKKIVGTAFDPKQPVDYNATASCAQEVTDTPPSEGLVLRAGHSAGRAGAMDEEFTLALNGIDGPTKQTPK